MIAGNSTLSHYVLPPLVSIMAALFSRPVLSTVGLPEAVLPGISSGDTPFIEAEF